MNNLVDRLSAKEWTDPAREKDEIGEHGFLKPSGLGLTKTEHGDFKLNRKRLHKVTSPGESSGFAKKLNFNNNL